ncbi:MAG: hypothetical protein U1F43_03585 [Myxococcota bacterium]
MRPAPFLMIALASAALASACTSSDPAADGPPSSETLSEPSDGAELKADGSGVSTGTPPGTLVRLQLEHGAFPASGTLPNAVVYVPKAFDPTAPVGLVVYLHGFWNCAENVLRPKNGACVAGRAAHNAYNLANQLEASGRNALLLVPELAFEQASSDPGRLAEQDAFYDLVDEALTQLAAADDQVGSLALWDLTTIVVASHSGGYKAAAGIASVGGLWVDELYLLDSLYGMDDAFDAYLQDDLDALQAAPPTRRFADVYSKDAGTLAASQAMAKRAAAALPAAALLDDRTTATLTTAQYAHGALFKRTGLGHDDIPRYYFGRLLATSSLPGH